MHVVWACMVAIVAAVVDGVYKLVQDKCIECRQENWVKIEIVFASLQVKEKVSRQEKGI